MASTETSPSSPLLFLPVIHDGMECALEVSASLSTVCLKTLVRERSIWDCPLPTIFAVHCRPNIPLLELCHLRDSWTSIVRHRLRFQSPENARECCVALQKAAFFDSIDDEHIPPLPLDPLTHRRHILIILNPQSGKKKALKRFRRFCAPILDLSHLTYELQFTQRSGHAADIVRSSRFDPSDGFTELGIFGGDGTIYETIQGLFTHPLVPYTELANLPISVFPGGTGNALAWEFGVLNNSLSMSSLICARGRTAPSDICSLFQDGQRKWMSLVVGYGIHADTDHQLKWLDWLGDGKYFIAPALLMMRFTRYPARLKLVKLENQITTPNDPCPEPRRCSAWSPSCQMMSEEELLLLQNRQNEEEEEEEGEGEGEEEEVDEIFADPRREAPFGFMSQIPCPLISEHFQSEMANVAPNHIPELMDERLIGPLPSGPYIEHCQENSLEREEEEEEEERTVTVVETFDSEFFMLTINMTKKLAEDIWCTYHNSMNSGWLDVLALHRDPNLGRLDCMKFFFNSAMAEIPTHITEEACSGQEPGVLLERCLAFCFEPLPPPGSEPSIDGEAVTCSTIIGEVHQGILKFVVY